MFGCFFLIFRSITSFIFGIVIFLGFFAFLMMTTFRDNFLTAEFYTESLAENNVYNRIYDEVLPDEDFADTTSELLGDIKDVPQSDIKQVTREIIPPEYLQDEVEGAIIGTIDYLNKETDTPEVYIHFEPPLSRVKPALFDYIDSRIDALGDKRVDTMDELQAELESIYRKLENGEIPDEVPFIEDTELLVVNYVNQTIEEELDSVQVRTRDALESELENVYKDLAKGELPTTIPSIDIDAISVADRLAAYDEVLRAIKVDPNVSDEAFKALTAQDQDSEIRSQLEAGSVEGALKVATSPLTGPVVEDFLDDAYDRVFQTLKEGNFPQKALDGLDSESAAIKEKLGEGSVKESLKIGARGLADPLIDEALDELRKELDAEERLDLIERAAKQNNTTKEEFLDDLDVVRNVIERTDVGVWVAILVIVLAVMLMGFVHIPHLASSMRWPGITLFLTGAVFLIIGLVLGKLLPDRFDELLDRGAESSDIIPASMIDIISDVLTSMGSDIANGFITPSIVIMIVGFVMLIGSFVLRMLHIPFLSR